MIPVALAASVFNAVTAHAQPTLDGSFVLSASVPRLRVYADAKDCLRWYYDISSVELDNRLSTPSRSIAFREGPPGFQSMVTQYRWGVSAKTVRPEQASAIAAEVVGRLAKLASQDEELKTLVYPQCGGAIDPATIQILPTMTEVAELPGRVFGGRLTIDYRLGDADKGWSIDQTAILSLEADASRPGVEPELSRMFEASAPRELGELKLKPQSMLRSELALMRVSKAVRGDGIRKALESVTCETEQPDSISTAQIVDFVLGRGRPEDRCQWKGTPQDSQVLLAGLEVRLASEGMSQDDQERIRTSFYRQWLESAFSMTTAPAPSDLSTGDDQARYVVTLKARAPFDESQAVFLHREPLTPVSKTLRCPLYAPQIAPAQNDGFSELDSPDFRCQRDNYERRKSRFFGTQGDVSDPVPLDWSLCGSGSASRGRSGA
jgi:hypothetical protein